MNNIIDPANGQSFSIFSEQGKALLKSYVKMYQSGGELTKEQLITAIERAQEGLNEAINEGGGPAHNPIFQKLRLDAIEYQNNIGENDELKSKSVDELTAIRDKILKYEDLIYDFPDEDE